MRARTHSVTAWLKLPAVLVALVGLWTVEAQGQPGPISDGKTWAAEEAPGAPPDSVAGGPVSVRLRDGSVLRGRIVRQNENELFIVTVGGVEVTVPRSAIAAIHRLDRETFEEMRSDPNYSRLMFAPTGRPLREGETYFFDYYVLFPGVAYGVSEHLTLMAGMSVVPGLAFGDQLFYFAPKFGMDASGYALSGGSLFVSAPEGYAAGIAFGVATLGEQDQSATVGLGLGFTKDGEDEEFRFVERPILLLGGNLRVSNSVALVSENWLILGHDFDLSVQPFAVAVRFFGERIAVDAGFILVGEILKEGFPIPWLSFVYNFGEQSRT